MNTTNNFGNVEKTKDALLLFFRFLYALCLFSQLGHLTNMNVLTPRINVVVLPHLVFVVVVDGDGYFFDIQS